MWGREMWVRGSLSKEEMLELDLKERKGVLSFSGLSSCLVGREGLGLVWVE